MRSYLWKLRTRLLFDGAVIGFFIKIFKKLLTTPHGVFRIHRTDPYREIGMQHRNRGSQVPKKSPNLNLLRFFQPKKSPTKNVRKDDPVQSEVPASKRSRKKVFRDSDSSSREEKTDEEMESKSSSESVEEAQASGSRRIQTQRGSSGSEDKPSESGSARNDPKELYENIQQLIRWHYQFKSGDQEAKINMERKAEKFKFIKICKAVRDQKNQITQGDNGFLKIAEKDKKKKSVEVEENDLLLSAFFAYLYSAILSASRKRTRKSTATDIAFEDQFNTEERKKNLNAQKIMFKARELECKHHSYFYALAMYEGIIFDKNHTLSRLLLKRSFEREELENHLAFFLYAKLCYKGQGGRCDYHEAEKYLKKIMDDGLPEDIKADKYYFLGDIAYHEHLKGKQDPNLAKSYYSQSNRLDSQICLKTLFSDEEKSEVEERNLSSRDVSVLKENSKIFDEVNLYFSKASKPRNTLELIKISLKNQKALFLVKQKLIRVYKKNADVCRLNELRFFVVDELIHSKLEKSMHEKIIDEYKEIFRAIDPSVKIDSTNDFYFFPINYAIAYQKIDFIILLWVFFLKNKKYSKKIENKLKDFCDHHKKNSQATVEQLIMSVFVKFRVIHHEKYKKIFKLCSEFLVNHNYIEGIDQKRLFLEGSKYWLLQNKSLLPRKLAVILSKERRKDFIFLLKDYYHKTLDGFQLALSSYCYERLRSNKKNKEANFLKSVLVKLAPKVKLWKSHPEYKEDQFFQNLEEIESRGENVQEMSSEDSDSDQECGYQAATHQITSNERDFREILSKIEFILSHQQETKDKKVANRLDVILNRSFESKSEKECKKIYSNSISEIQTALPAVVAQFNPAGAKTYSQEVHEDLRRLNTMLAQGKLDEGLSSIRTNFIFAQSRGIHFRTNKSGRHLRAEYKKLAQMPHHPLHNRPVFSPAVYESAKVNSYTDLRDASQLKLEKHAKLLQERLLDGFRDEERHEMHEQYSNNYAKFFNTYWPQKTKEKNFQCCTKNPFVSTGGIDGLHDLRYAYGLKQYGDQEKIYRLRPCYKKAKPLRPTSGLVFLTLHPLEDLLRQDSFDVVSHNMKGHVSIKKEISPERELAFYSYIPENRLKFIHIAKYPSFQHGSYPKIFLRKYGIKEDAFNKFNEIFTHHSPHSPNHRLAVHLLGEYLSAFHRLYLKRYAYDYIEKLNANSLSAKYVLVYRDEYGFFSLSPVPPKNLNPTPAITDEKTLLRTLSTQFIQENKKTEQLLQWVSEGKQKEVTEILKNNKKLNLAFCKGRLQDPSGRVFNCISPFQYAVWALDWHMWKAIQPFLSEEEQKNQLNALQQEKTEHGEYFDFSSYVNSLQFYAKYYQEWVDEEKRDYIVKTIGQQQRALPMHVIHTYCRTDIQYDENSTFKEEKLPRETSLNSYKGPVLFGLFSIEDRDFSSISPKELGIIASIFRGYRSKKACKIELEEYDSSHDASYVEDSALLSNFFQCRFNQRKALFAAVLGSEIGTNSLAHYTASN